MRCTEKDVVLATGRAGRWAFSELKSGQRVAVDEVSVGTGKAGPG